MNQSTIPKWETAVMLLSFVALWAWWLARQSQARLAGGLAEHPLPYAWYGVLLVAFAALIVVFVRRMKRVQAALRENLKRPPAPFGLPPAENHGDGKHGKSRSR